MRKQPIELEGYNQVLNDIKFLLDKAKAQAYKAVDNIRVQTYWQVGDRIIREELQHKERAEYGKKLIENLAKDLGFEKRLIFEIIQFYKVYPIVHALSAQLSWTHYNLLVRINNREERQFYESQTVQNGWSTRELERQIKNRLYYDAKKIGKLILNKPLDLAIKPEDIFKNTYNFEFLDLKSEYKEEDFKNGLLNKLKKFLQELGPDFFVGRREVPILIAGNYDKVDLELFHAGLMCYILVEVKVEPFKHSHVSQMYSYLNCIRKIN